MNEKPTVALVGRPNVGKSALFNRITGKRISIVEETPGVTRDRVYGEGEWQGIKFNLIDTGGITSDEDELLKHVLAQAEIAISEADVVVFVVDGQSGITTADEEVAHELRKSDKPVILAVNKSEHDIYGAGIEFYRLGFGKIVAVSALHGTNTGELLDQIARSLPELPSYPDHYKEEIAKIAVVGRPNVGKSSLINKILRQERLIVSDIPGTTRDAIDTLVTNKDKRYLFIDTAGLRKKSSVKYKLEHFSVLRSIKSIERSDVALLLIDACDHILDQDKKIASMVLEQGKGLIILINKWDAIEKDQKTADNFKEMMHDEIPNLNFAPVLFVSAKTGKGLDKIFPMIDRVKAEHQKRIPTADLNRVIESAVTYNPPPFIKGKKLKIYYITQVKTCPPTFVLFINDSRLIKNSYKRYLENQLRRIFVFEGTPLRIIERERKRR